MVGDYISREAVLAHIKEAQCQKCSDIGLCGNCAVLTAVRLVESVPAADVVEVRHGRWIKDGEDGPVYCSECGEEHEWEDYRASYCDACGAKMDGGQDE